MPDLADIHTKACLKVFEIAVKSVPEPHRSVLYASQFLGSIAINTYNSSDGLKTGIYAGLYDAITGDVGSMGFEKSLKNIGQLFDYGDKVSGNEAFFWNVSNAEDAAQTSVTLIQLLINSAIEIQKLRSEGKTLDSRAAASIIWNQTKNVAEGIAVDAIGNATGYGAAYGLGYAAKGLHMHHAVAKLLNNAHDDLEVTQAAHHAHATGHATHATGHAAHAAGHAAHAAGHAAHAAGNIAAAQATHAAGHSLVAVGGHTAMHSGATVASTWATGMGGPAATALAPFATGAMIAALAAYGLKRAYDGTQHTVNIHDGALAASLIECQLDRETADTIGETLHKCFDKELFKAIMECTSEALNEVSLRKEWYDPLSAIHAQKITQEDITAPLQEKLSHLHKKLREFGYHAHDHKKVKANSKLFSGENIYTLLQTITYICSTYEPYNEFFRKFYIFNKDLPDILLILEKNRGQSLEYISNLVAYHCVERFSLGLKTNKPKVMLGDTTKDALYEIHNKIGMEYKEVYETMFEASSPSATISPASSAATPASPRPIEPPSPITPITHKTLSNQKPFMSMGGHKLQPGNRPAENKLATPVNTPRQVDALTPRLQISPIVASFTEFLDSNRCFQELDQLPANSAESQAYQALVNHLHQDLLYKWHFFGITTPTGPLRQAEIQGQLNFCKRVAHEFLPIIREIRHADFSGAHPPVTVSKPFLDPEKVAKIIAKDLAEANSYQLGVGARIDDTLAGSIFYHPNLPSDFEAVMQARGKLKFYELSQHYQLLDVRRPGDTTFTANALPPMPHIENNCQHVIATHRLVGHEDFKALMEATKRESHALLSQVDYTKR